MGQNCGARQCPGRAAASSAARFAVGGVLSPIGLRWRRGKKAPRGHRSRAAGFCGEVDARDMSPAEIEVRAGTGGAVFRSPHRSSIGKAFSWKCRASWPCAAPCKRDFVSCPEAGRRGGASARDGARVSRRPGGVKAAARARHRRNTRACAGTCGGALRVGRDRPAVLRTAAPLICPTALRRRRRRGRSCATPRGPRLFRGQSLANRSSTSCFAGRARDKTYVWLAKTGADIAWIARAPKRISVRLMQRSRTAAAARLLGPVR